MPTSLVVVRYQHEFLIVEGNKYASEENRVPLRVKLPLGSTKEDARPHLSKAHLPRDVYSESVHVGTPYGKRSPSGNNMVYTARALVPSGIWGFVKGQCNEYGLEETPLDCAVRELQEETSLEADRSRLQRIKAIRSIDAYILDVTAEEKDKIKTYLASRNDLSRGEIFGNFWSKLHEIPPGLTINQQSQRVLDYLNRVVIQPAPVPASLASAAASPASMIPPGQWVPTAAPAPAPASMIPPGQWVPTAAPAPAPAPGPVTRSRSGESAKKRTARDDVVSETPRSTRSRSGDTSMSPVPTSLASMFASPASMIPPGQWVPTAAPAPAPAPASMIPPGQWVPTAAPAPAPAPAPASIVPAGQWVPPAATAPAPPHRRGGKTRRKKTARKRRTTRKVR
jgi:8-oxo-dGTP pyrophosphatase MutT (NUDIX family)